MTSETTAPITAHLRCPRTGHPLHEVEGEAFERARQDVSAPGVTFEDGTSVPSGVERLFQSDGGEHLYVQADSILYLTEGKALDPEVTGGPLAVAPKPRWSEAKRSVQNFYDETGWKKEDGTYIDTKLFSEVSDVASQYKTRVMDRVTRRLGTGTFLLNVASGTVPSGPDTSYAQGFERHVCMDLSLTALQEARSNLGDRGVYILGDITNIPLQEGSMDGCVSLHTIYHVPKEEQARAFRELYRVLKPGGTAAVVYNWGRHAVLPNLLTLPIQIARYVHKRVMPKERDGQPTLRTLYFHAHGPSWFEQQDWPFDYEVEAFHSPNNQFLNLYARDNAVGRRILQAVYDLEERYPQTMGKLGYYPLIVIRKALST